MKTRTWGKLGIFGELECATMARDLAVQLDVRLGESYHSSGQKSDNCCADNGEEQGKVDDGDTLPAVDQPSGTPCSSCCGTAHWYTVKWCCSYC